MLFYRLVIVPLLAFLPAPLAYGIACLRGDGRYWFDTDLRKRIMDNLEAVLGDQLSQVERARVARDFFRRQSCQDIDDMRIAGRGRALARLVEIRGLEHIETALAKGKGAIICSAHFGSYNSCFSLIGACDFPITAVGDWVYKSDPYMSLLPRLIWRRASSEKRLIRRRRRPNIEPREGEVKAAIEIAKILRANELIAIPIDVPVSQNERLRAVPVEFLGRQILLLPGTASIAQYTGATLLVLVVHRSADWRHQVLEISPPVPLDGDIETAFKHCVALVEASIRQYPAFWDYWRSTQGLIDLGLLSTES